MPSFNLYAALVLALSTTALTVHADTGTTNPYDYIDVGYISINYERVTGDTTNYSGPRIFVSKALSESFFVEGEFRSVDASWTGVDFHRKDYEVSFNYLKSLDTNFDVYAGIGYWHYDTTAKFSPSGNVGKGDGNFVVPSIGVRYQLNDSTHLNVELNHYDEQGGNSEKYNYYNAHLTRAITDNVSLNFTIGSETSNDSKVYIGSVRYSWM